MKIEVNVSKKHMFAFVFVIVAFSALFFVYAYGSTPANPPVFGHTPSETGQGSDFNTFGGTSTFNGPSGSQWYFPGIVGVGGKDPGYRSFYVTNHSLNGDAVIGIGSGGTGAERISFIHNGAEKALISWESSSSALEINGIYTTVNTIINPAGGKVGIGMSPIGTAKLQVNGNVNVSGNGNIYSTGDLTSRNIDASGTISGASVQGGTVYSGYTCINAGVGPINPATDSHCTNGVPLQNNVAVTAVTLTSGVPRTNTGKAALFFSGNTEPPQNGWVKLQLKKGGVGQSWFDYVVMTKAGSGGYGRSPQITAFVPAGYSYQLVSSDGSAPWGQTFETTFG